MHIKPLPPLNSLIAFESAARHLSFTLAAQELNLTQSAVSKAIRQLESYLGRPLFVREKRSLSLTPTGISFYGVVHQSLQQISVATRDIVQWQGEQQLTVMTSNAMASFWLLPKIGEFQDQHPEVDLRLMSTDSIKNVRFSEYDIALFYCQTPPPSLNAIPLFNETVFPVCSPSYKEKMPPIDRPEDLLKATLLSLELNEEWITWTDWCNEFIPDFADRKARTINMNNYLLVIQSALNGQGIALGWEHLVDDYLNSGLLVKATDSRLVTQSQFYLLEPPLDGRPKLGVEKFKNWLMTQIKKDNL